MLEGFDRNDKVLDLVSCFEFVLQKLVSFADFVPKYAFEGLGVGIVHLSGFFEADVSGVESLDSFDSNIYELLPANELVSVLVGKGDEHGNIVVVEAVTESPESILEFLVGELSAAIGISLPEHVLKCAPESAYEPGGLDIYLL